MEEKKHHKLIQSYVQDKYFISTIYRQSSIAMYNPPWYYETMGWEWDKETKESGKMLLQNDSGHEPEYAIREHCAICVKIVKGEKFDETL